MLRQLIKRAVIARYSAAIDFDLESRFSSVDLTGWPERLLILEGDDDRQVEADARAALRALYPHAQVHTFHGAGHAAAMAGMPGYARVIKRWLADNWRNLLARFTQEKRWAIALQWACKSCTLPGSDKGKTGESR